MANSKTEAKDLSCLFRFLIKDYLESDIITKPEYEILVRKIDKLECLNKQLLIENDILKKRLNNKFDNQEERIKAIIEIAKQDIIQELELQSSVNKPDILVPDPRPIDPNSIDNVRKVFNNIQKISRINNSS
ncbi:14741_t:CDS:2 [Gigaspora margarita]|uniref:14741_t:CDS:1 n=1 Tax=Gigaspora margarita TaxID=4874 RepID=A0ABN7VGU9_GIGMA|nr:14741_t:CDS:2 [Gigaspora margarita]